MTGSGWQEKPSTRLGNALGHSARAAAYLLDYALPLAVMSAYRLIPGERRGRMFGGPSTSLTAVAELRAAGGGGWQVIRGAMSNHPPRPELP